jgi:hypothetical protein
MLEKIYEMDATRVIEELENVQNHYETCVDYENNEADIGELKRASEDHPVTKLIININEELENAYEAAEWT